MAAPALVEADLNLGRDVYDAIRDDSVLRPSAALWLYDDDAQEWRFLIASEQARKFGPKAAYSRVHALLKRAGLLGRMPVRRIAVTTPDDPVLAAIETAVAIEPGAAGVFYDCVFNDVPVSGMAVFQIGNWKPGTVEAAASVSH
jgi:hypothetical protein